MNFYRIERRHKNVENAIIGDPIGVIISGITDDTKPKQGDIMLMDNTPVNEILQFTVILKVEMLENCNDNKISIGQTFYVSHTQFIRKIKCKMLLIKWKIKDSNPSKKEYNPTCIEALDTAEVIFVGIDYVFVRTYDISTTFGSVIIWNGGKIYMIGKVKSIINIKMLKYVIYFWVRKYVKKIGWFEGLSVIVNNYCR